MRGNIKEACREAKIGRQTFYDRRNSDEEFARLAGIAIEEACDALEAEAWRRAHDGVDEPVYGSGGPGAGTVQVGTVRKYSDGLLQTLLKAHRPDKYRDNVKQEITGPNGGVVVVKMVGGVSTDDL